MNDLHIDSCPLVNMFKKREGHFEFPDSIIVSISMNKII